MFWIFDQAVCKVWIGIIGQNIQTLVFHLVVVHIAKNTVCGNEIFRFLVFADDIALHFAETNRAVRNKTIII